MERELYLNTVLSQHNIPISVPIKNKDNQYYVNDDNKIYCLYHSLQGNHADDLFSLEQAHLFGEAISRLHNGLLDCDPQKLKVFDMDIKRQLIDWAIPYSSALDENVEKIENHLVYYLFPLLESIPVQIIHRDAHPYNILFQNNSLTGFLDFDITTIGIRIFDICYCSTAILMGEFSNLENREKWFGVLKELIKGYQGNILLDNAELQAIFPVILSIQLLFIAYFKDVDPSLAKMNLEGLFWIFENRMRIEEVIGF